MLIKNSLFVSKYIIQVFNNYNFKCENFDWRKQKNYLRIKARHENKNN